MNGTLNALGMSFLLSTVASSLCHPVPVSAPYDIVMYRVDCVVCHAYTTCRVPCIQCHGIVSCFACRVCIMVLCHAYNIMVYALWYVLCVICRYMCRLGCTCTRTMACMRRVQGAARRAVRCGCRRRGARPRLGWRERFE